MTFLAEIINALYQLIVNVDVELASLIRMYGVQIYSILFAIIFCETGLVVTPFMPGDSLLFVSGAFAAVGMLHLPSLFLIVISGAILGNTVNYEIGRLIGPKIFKMNKNKLIKREHLVQSRDFFNKYGIYSVVLSRFMPIIRTFTPFLAGVFKMNRFTYQVYNILGAILWASLFLLLGYFLGNIDFVKNNYSFFILGIIVVSLIPAVLSFKKGRVQ